MIAIEKFVQRCPEVFKKTVNICSDPIIIMDENHKIVFANKSFEETFGYTSKEYINKHPKLLLCHPDYTLVDSEIEKSINRGEEWSGEILTKSKDGREIWQFVRITYFIKNGYRYHIAAHSNITEIKDVEERLVGLCNKLEI
jgi:PAS domain S-box-containing protein